mmetsp:Transcript_23228/g.48235  ORF Transcript_23228/g.48235 Transcript_23228/m.48235 type:complete len:263 (-) Transcript_23228:148-936(-)
MFHVFFVEVRWSNVGSSSEPPHASIGLKITVVEMHRRTEGIARVHHTRQPTGEEGNSLPRRHSLGPVHTALGSRLQRFLGHRSIHHRKIDPGFFPHGSVFENARHPPSSVGASPAIFLEGGFSVDFGDGIGDGDLCFAEHFFEAGSHGVISVGSVSRADEGVGCVVHSRVRIPSDGNGRSILRLLSIVGSRRLGGIVGNASGEKRALEGFPFDGGGGSAERASRGSRHGHGRKNGSGHKSHGGRSESRRYDEKGGAAEVHDE